VHCSETAAIVEAKCKTIRFDSQRRRCVKMGHCATWLPPTARGTKCEVVVMMKEQYGQGDEVASLERCSAAPQKTA
jgi:hypothetical protein